jgi:hypothetical protein
MTHNRYLEAVTQVDLRAYRTGASKPSLLMSEAGNLTIEYAPFDHIERDAELVIVGLTPGRQQAANALETLGVELRKGTPTPLALERAKRTASFSGPMRSNLLNMLDAIGVPALFGRQHAAEFFSDAKARVHFTSSLRYPVYVDGENYSGSPKPLSHPLLRGMIDTHLFEEAKALPKAIWVPLGQHAEAALLHLSSNGHLDRAKILAGLPHPSGANAERIAYFLGRKAKQDLSAKTNPDTLDRQKAVLVDQVQRLRENAGR